MSLENVELIRAIYRLWGEDESASHLIDPDLEWTVDREASFSRSRNTPFHGWKLKGRAVQTIVGGQTVWKL